MRLIALLATLIPAAALATGYDTAVPDLSLIACSFSAVTDPPVPATGVQLIRNLGETFSYIWIEEGLPPLPVLAIFRLPDTPGALTTIISPDLGGQFGMITYGAGGDAMLSRHSQDPDGGIAGTAQRGACSETKGA